MNEWKRNMCMGSDAPHDNLPYFNVADISKVITEVLGESPDGACSRVILLPLLIRSKQNFIDAYLLSVSTALYCHHQFLYAALDQSKYSTHLALISAGMAEHRIF